MTAVSLLAGVIFGLFPAIEVTAVDLRSALAEAGRGGTGSRRQRKRQMLVFAEVTLGVVLVVSAGLLLRTLFTLLHIDPGFQAKNVVTASLSLQDARYKTTADTTRLFRNSLDQIHAIPGIESAAVALSLPYQRALNLNMPIFQAVQSRGAPALLISSMQHRAFLKHCAFHCFAEGSLRIAIMPARPKSPSSIKL
jgi:putative ABC transport system permease protein